MIICLLLFLKLFADGSEIVSLSSCGEDLVIGELEGFALIPYRRVLSVGSGVVTGVWFGGLDVGWIEKNFFSNIHIFFCYTL